MAKTLSKETDKLVKEKVNQYAKGRTRRGEEERGGAASTRPEGSGGVPG